MFNEMQIQNTNTFYVTGICNTNDLRLCHSHVRVVILFSFTVNRSAKQNMTKYKLSTEMISKNNSSCQVQ